jgi:hypothetical protein
MTDDFAHGFNDGALRHEAAFVIRHLSSMRRSREVISS